MAWVTGTATNYKDALNKLKTFLTTNAALVSAGQEWEAVRFVSSDELCLKGTGLTGTDEIYVNMKAFETPSADIYNILVVGAAGYNAANQWDDQAGVSPTVGVSLSNDSMKYWFIANGRRFITVFKVGSSYCCGYFGLFLPYATPNQYPYPLIIGGNLYAAFDTPRVANSSSTGIENSNFWNPMGHSGVIHPNINYASQTLVYWVDGGWQYAAQNVGQNAFFLDQTCRDNIDGTYTLFPIPMFFTQPSRAWAGELDGVYLVSGFSNAPENIITKDAIDYLVVQNVFRNGVGDFAALKLV